MSSDGVTVYVPVGMAPLTDGKRRVVVHGSTVREVVEALEAAYPGFRESLITHHPGIGDRLRPGLSIAVDSEVQALGLLAQVPPGAEVHILPAMAGGGPRSTDR